MGKLAQYSLANRAAIALFTLIIAIGGVISMGSLKQELIPSISIPQVAVVTVVPGASPEIIDRQVSVPLSRALENIAGVETVTAVSSTNVATVTLGTEFGLDQISLKAEIKNVVEEVSGLPENAMDPQVIFGSTADLPVLYFTASSDANIAQLSSSMQNVVIPEISRIDGVRNVTLQGGLTQRIVITPNPEALATGITPTDLQNALEANGTQIPAGTVTTDDQGSLAVQAGTLITSVKDIAALPVLSEAGVSTIGDLASVELVNEDPTSITRTNGQESLSLSITAVPDADIVALSHTIVDTLPQLAEKAGDNTEFTIVSDQAPFIEESIKDLAIEGGLGLIFAVAVILLFLMSARSTLVTAVSIPLSVLVTFIGLNVGGYSLNMLTLGALTISIGRVVDDSIVVIENIKRHLSYGTKKKQAILVAVKEVASAITASTLTTIMVFIPIAIVGGMVGELFRPFALTVAIAMGSSLLVALTIVPVLAYWFLPQPKTTKAPAEIQAKAQAKEENSFLQRAYIPMLRGTQRRPVITILVSVALLVGSLALIPTLKTDFLGDTGQNAIAVMQEFDSGADLDTIDEGATATEQALLGIEGVEDVLFTVSTGGGDPMAALFGGGSTTAQFQVTTDPDADQSALAQVVSERLAELPLADTISSGADAMGFGSSAVDVQIMAVDDPDALGEATDQIMATLGKLEHAGEMTNNRAEVTPNIQLTVNREAAAQAGLTEIQVSGMVASMLNETAVQSVRVDNKSVQIYIDNGMRISTLTELENLVLPTPAGMIPLTEIAEIEQVNSPSTVRRVQGELSATVSIIPASGELSKATTEINTALEKLDLPTGVSYEIGGVSAQQTEAFEQLGLAMLIAIAIVYALMVLTFRSLLQPLILMVSVPFAAIGAIVALLVSGTPLGVASLIGLLMLIGIVVTNAIVLMDLINQYREQGQNVHDAVLHGSRQRLRPILMTAIATIFALIPMALGFTGSTGFISKDLAVVVIGGLISSTALTLILVPVLYRMVEGAKERRHHKKAHAAAPEAAVQPAADAATE